MNNIYTKEVSQRSKEFLQAKRVKVPDWAHGTKYCEIQTMAHSVGLEMGSGFVDKHNASYWVMAYGSFGQFNRVYVPTKALVEDLSRTSIKGLDLPTLHWPVGGFMICPPKGSLILNSAEVNGILLAEGHLGHEKSFIICAAMSDGAAYSMHHLQDDFSMEVIDQNDPAYSELDMFKANPVEDKDELKSIITFALKFLSYLNAVPADTTEGSPSVRRAGAETAFERKQKPLHPWIVGLDREVKRGNGSLGGTHASPMAHWRSGHWRHQRHGEGMTKTKLMWIEPTLVKGSK